MALNVCVSVLQSLTGMTTIMFHLSERRRKQKENKERRRSRLPAEELAVRTTEQHQ